MKRFGLTLLMLPFLMLSSCATGSTFRKPSFKKYSNEVSFEEFSTSFIAKYKSHSLLGENGEIKKNMVFNGYSYGDANRVIKTKNSKTMYSVSASVSNKIQAQYDNKRGLGNSDIESRRTESNTAFKTSTNKSSKESNIKTQYTKGESGKGVIGVYQKPKIYIKLDDEMSVSRYLASSVASTFTFGESFLPNYAALSPETKEKYHFYIDKDVYTIVLKEEVKYTYHALVGETETEYATSLTVNNEKRQYVLTDKPIYASTRTSKETKIYTMDYANRINGDIETYNFKNYIKSQISYKYVSIKAINYKSFDCVSQLPVVD